MRVLSFEQPTEELTDEEIFAAQDAEEANRKEMLDRLSRLLLNPSLDRCDVADGILGDRDLIQFLCGCKNIELVTVAPRGSDWDEMQTDDFMYASIVSGFSRPRDVFVMPLMLGVILDEDGRPWFQASPHEFIPTIAGIKTTNILGEPMFRADLDGPLSTSSISAKEKFSTGESLHLEVC